MIILWYIIGTTILVLNLFRYAAKQIDAKSIMVKAFGSVAIFAFILLGMLLVKVHDPSRYANHYVNSAAIQKHSNTLVPIQFYIQERLKPSTSYERYIVDLEYADDCSVSGKLLLKLPKDSLPFLCAIGDRYTALGILQPILKPQNPGQFDYARYMRMEYVYHQMRLSSSQLIKHHSVKWSIARVADRVRTKVYRQLAPFFDTTQMSIINALLLGQRQEIAPSLYEAYKNAGAVHMLAISGLHVGVFLGILTIVFRPLERLGKYGKIIKTILIVLIIWSVAFISGLSLSVLRAVIMFSCMVIGAHIRPHTDRYATLLLSAFIIVCIQPLAVFTVSFQLSYTAVGAILWIQPMLYQCYHSRWYLLQKLWQILSVTLAAQLGVLPLSLYYFHQFPVLFFVTNLCVLPFLGILIGIGIFNILWSSIIGDPLEGVVFVLGKGIDMINALITWVAKQKAFLITDIPCTLPMVVVLYILLGSIMCRLQGNTKGYYNLLIPFFLCVILGGLYIHDKATQTSELVIYHAYKNTIIGIQEEGKLYPYSRTPITTKTEQYLLKPHQLQYGLQLQSLQELKHIYWYKQKSILIVDSDVITKVKGVQPDVLVLSHSPKIHVVRMINSLQPKQIIADGSNYRTDIDRWEYTCKLKNIPFHRTDTQGAFIME